MIYCTNCGSPSPDGAVVCEVCGAALPRIGAAKGEQPQPPPQPVQSSSQTRPAPSPSPAAVPARTLSSTDKLGIFAGNLCLSPVLGVVLYFVWRDRHPERAAQTCTLTRWAVGIWVALIVLAMLGGLLSEM